MTRRLPRPPARSAKPREPGITHVLDSGLSLRRGRRPDRGRRRQRRHRQARLGHGAGHRATCDAKLARYRAHGIPVVLGGTLTRARDPRRAASTGSSPGCSELGLAPRRGLRRHDRARAASDKRELIARLATRASPCFSEVGSKDAERDHGPLPLGRADRGRARGRRVEGHRRGARDRHGRHLPPRRRGAHGPDRRDRPRRRPGRGCCSRRRARSSRCGSSSASGREVNLGNIAPGRRALARDAAPRAALGHGGASPDDPARPPRGDRRTTPSAASRARATCRSTTAAASRPRELARARRGRSAHRRAVLLSRSPRARETAEIVGARHRPRAAASTRASPRPTRGDWTGPPVRRRRARATRSCYAACQRRRPGRSASRAASRSRSSRSASSRASSTSRRPARCRRSSSATAARSASRCATPHRRGLAAFHATATSPTVADPA